MQKSESADVSWRIAVLGAGSWGTALAHMVAARGHHVRLWAFEQEVAQGINDAHRNPAFLKDVDLHARVVATNDLHEAVQDVQMVLFAIPAQWVRSYLKEIRDSLPVNIPLVICSKGIERQTLATMDEVFAQELSAAHHSGISVLSGPSFAAEVVGGMPTNVTLACHEPRIAKACQTALSSRSFRVYTTDDVVGVEIGGALKNVMAIAAGASDGLGFGANTRAGLLTRGLAEMTRLAVNMGGRPETLLGLAGVGDLILTCTGDLSRNRSVGKLLAEGLTRQQIESRMNMVAEGVPTAESAYQLSLQRGVDLPITQQLYLVLYEGKTVVDGMKALQNRTLKQEWQT